MRSFILGAAFAAMLPVAAQAQDAAAGEKAFTACKACHAFGKNGAGPDLKGVVGRKAGSHEGFSYSDALKNSGLTWDEATLKEWIKDPKAKVPGNKMMYAGIKDDKKLGDIVAYLASQK